TSAGSSLGSGAGGISPVCSFSETFSQTSGAEATDAGVAYGSRSRPPFFERALWQFEQFRARNGRTERSKSEGAADACSLARAETAAARSTRAARETRGCIRMAYVHLRSKANPVSRA